MQEVNVNQTLPIKSLPRTDTNFTDHHDLIENAIELIKRYNEPPRPQGPPGTTPQSPKTMDEELKAKIEEGKKVQTQMDDALKQNADKGIPPFAGDSLPFAREEDMGLYDPDTRGAENGTFPFLKINAPYETLRDMRHYPVTVKSKSGGARSGRNRGGFQVYNGKQQYYESIYSKEGSLVLAVNMGNEYFDDQWTIPYADITFREYERFTGSRELKYLIFQYTKDFETTEIIENMVADGGVMSSRMPYRNYVFTVTPADNDPNKEWFQVLLDTPLGRTAAQFM